MAGVFAVVVDSDLVSNEVIQYPLMIRKEGRDERERERGEGGLDF